MENPHAGNLSEGSPEYWALVNPVLDVYEALPPEDVLTVLRAHSESGVDETNHVEALGHLPARNPEHAAAVYRAFAESPDPDVRGQIVMYLTRLSLVDRATGLELWDHLVRDPHGGVRAEAIDEIAVHLGTVSARDPAAFADEERMRQQHVGLTWQDIAHLFRTHLRAVQNHAYLYQPGSAGTPDSE